MKTEKKRKKSTPKGKSGGAAKRATLLVVRRKKITKRRSQKRSKPVPARGKRSEAKSKAKRPAAKSPKTFARVYAPKTIKLLFGLSRNQCAFPDCPKPIIIPGTDHSDKAIIGHICHIYAVSDEGPRGKPGLTSEQRNGFENLVLMCRDHHGAVDTQYETYPAKLLIKWKREHEAKATAGTPEALKEEAKTERHHFYQGASDEQIKEELRKLRQARLLPGFDAVGHAQILARHVREAKLAGGSTEVRASALAWCARILAHGETIPPAKELLSESLAMTHTAEGEIAKAFITASTDPKKAVAALAGNGSSQSLSAALMLQAIKIGPKKALKWFQSAGLSIDHLCPDGKYALISNALVERDWAYARSLVDRLTTADFDAAPALQFLAAFSHLLTAVTDELKPIAFVQIPLEADAFPLASRPEDLVEIRSAKVLFERVGRFALSVGVTRAANVAFDYALWLGLRDQESHAAAMLELRNSLDDPATSLRRLNFALRFGLKPDLAAIEERLDRSVALSGQTGPDEAYARFILALTKSDPRVAAEYISQHRVALLEHVNKALVTSIEIQVLVRADLSDTAKKRLTEAIRKRYISGNEKTSLERLIREGADADVVRQRRETYEAAGDLGHLMNLLHALEHERRWAELLPYAQKLFALSPSASSLERVVHCLNDLGRYAELHKTMSENPALVDQSENLKTIWAWSLFREGHLLDAVTACLQIADSRQPNSRRLRVNLAITTGNWPDLLVYCQQVWDERATHTASDLMHAAQLSIAVNGPHSRGLMEAALEKEPENARLLANAYFEATNAGWEQTREVSDWLKRAAHLSGEHGPIQQMSLREILDKRPKWEEQSANTWKELAQGKLPTVAAGQLLNRSLVDLYLLPSLSNIDEVDVRRRGVIYAYSGARLAREVPAPKTVAVDFAALVTFARLGLLEKLMALYIVAIPHATLGWLFQERKKATFHQPSRIKHAENIKHLIARQALQVVRPAPSRDDKLTAQVGFDLAAMLCEAREKSSPDLKLLVVRSSPLHRLGSDFTDDADVTGYENYICSCSAVVDRLMVKGTLTVPEEETARNYLKLTESRWPNEPAIDEHTELCLDDLSVSYFQAIGVLDKFKAAGLKVYISQNGDAEADALLTLHHLGNRQLQYVEDIRSVLEAGIRSGRVRVGRMSSEGQSYDAAALHPTYTALGLASIADVVVIDDRGLNHIQNLNDDGRVTPLLCSLDVLDLMRKEGALSEAEVFDHRTVLRKAGYQLIPVTDAELAHHLKNARPRNSGFAETAELKAIRESLLRARMSAIVQLPNEIGGLEGTLAALTRAIKNTWVVVADRTEAEARSDYLLAIVDPRQWAASAQMGSEKTFAQAVFGAFAVQLARPPLNADGDTRNAYYDWVTSRVISSTKTYQPEIYAWLVAHCRGWSAARAEDLVRDIEARNEQG